MCCSLLHHVQCVAYMHKKQGCGEREREREIEVGSALLGNTLEGHTIVTQLPINYWPWPKFIGPFSKVKIPSRF